MTKKRASLAGRGFEILFGQGADGTGAEPAPPSPSASDAEETPSEAMADSRLPANSEPTADAELEALLEAEAVTATAGMPAESLPADVDAAADEVAVAPVPAVEEVAPAAPAVEEVAPSAAVEVELPPLATAVAQPEEPAPTTTAEPKPVPYIPPVEGSATPTGTPVKPAGTPVKPVEEPVTPPAPDYGPEAGAEAPPASVPPPRDKAGAFGQVKLEGVESVLYGTTTRPSEEDLEPEGPKMAEVELRELLGYEKGQPSRAREEDEILSYVGARRRQSLWDEIDDLYREIPLALSTDAMQADALQLLQQAQDILLERPRQFDVARYKVSQVQSIVARRKNTTRWTNTYGWGAFFYEAVWFILLATAILFSSSLVNWIVAVAGSGHQVEPAVISAVQEVLPDVLALFQGESLDPSVLERVDPAVIETLQNAEPGVITALRGLDPITLAGVQAVDANAIAALVNTALWGGVGGVIGALYSLYWHAAKVKDFDKQYLMWYIVQPLVGLLLGCMVFLIVGSGFMVARGTTSGGAQTVVSLFPYAVSCIAGFRQRFILEIIDRIIQFLTSPFAKSQEEVEEPVQESVLNPPAPPAPPPEQE